MRYDYRCPVCGDVREVEHGMNEDPTVLCELCVAEPMSRVPSAGMAAVLKGEGWAGITERRRRAVMGEPLHGHRPAKTYSGAGAEGGRSEHSGRATAGPDAT